MFGMPFEGRGTEAYDNVSKQWISTWIDNMGTGLEMTTGSCNDAMTVCNYSGEMVDPMSGTKMKTHNTITWADDNSFKNEMYGTGKDGKDTKMMEVVAKRKG